MITPKNITFPITLETFIAIQEAELGRKADEIETEFFGMVVEMANASYMAACLGGLEAGAEAIETIENALGKELADTAYAAARFGDPVAVARIKKAQREDRFNLHLTALVRGWVVLACRRGLERFDADGELLS